MFFREPLRLLPHRDRVKLAISPNRTWGVRLRDRIAQSLGLRMAMQLLPNRVNRLLQIGFGDGYIMPELDSRTNQLFGIDEHELGAEVQDRLRLNGVNVQLARGLPDTLPYADGYFDRIVVLDGFATNVDWENAALEIVRVLNPTGRLVYVLGREAVAQEKVLLRSFEVLRELRFLPYLPNSLSLVRVLDLQPYAVDVTPHARSKIRQRIAV
jgi:SAM-dependent methyltransferase